MRKTLHALALTLALAFALAFAPGCARSVVDDDVGMSEPASTSDAPSPTLPGLPATGGGSGDASIPPPPGHPDGGPPDAAAGSSCNPGTAGALAVTPNEQWGWVADPAMKCGNGSATGFAINVTSKSSRVLVFLMGGGGCYDAATCGGQDSAHTAAHLDGYSAVTAQQDLGQLGAGSVFDRTAPQNPFKDYSFVFVPYCTGDFHTGSTVASYGTNHVGATNMKRVLAYLVPTFCPAVSRIALMGSSAGGFGAVFNYEVTASAFAPVRVDLVDDSGPPMPPSAMPLQATMRAAWGAAVNAPAGCAGCASSWAAYLPFLASAHPGARFSLLASTHDVSICPYFGNGLQAPAACKVATTALATQYAALPNVRVWMSDEFTHVFASSGFTQKTSLGTLLATFVKKQVDDDPSWSSVVPP